MNASKQETQKRKQRPTSNSEPQHDCSPPKKQLRLGVTPPQIQHNRIISFIECIGYGSTTASHDSKSNTICIKYNPNKTNPSQISSLIVSAFGNENAKSVLIKYW
eukprot:395831_1